MKVIKKKLLWLLTEEWEIIAVTDLINNCIDNVHLLVQFRIGVTIYKTVQK